MAEEREPVVRASEIGHYLYCSRSWWLGRVRGLPPANRQELAQGEARHAAHGRLVWAAQALRIAGYLFLALALLTGLVFIGWIWKGG